MAKVQLHLADAVTATRLALALAVAVLVVGAFPAPAPAAVLVPLATVALVLDAVDGRVARRTGTVSDFGARFDLEVDAFLILVLSVVVAVTTAPWALLIGAARYLLLVAGCWWPWLRGETPPRGWAKAVAAVQGIVLTAVASGLLPRLVALLALAVALALLAESFGHQVRQLWRARPAGGVPAPSAAGTMTAIVVLWLALVLPDRLRDVSPAAFARVPVELLVILALGLLAPAAARRPLAVAAGVALALVVVVKALDLGFSVVLDRPFDVLNDSYYLAPALGVVRDSSGTAAAVGVVLAVAAGLTILLLVLVGATSRAMAAAARHRRLAVPVVALAVAGTVATAADAGVVTAGSASVAARQVHAVRSDLADRRVFAREIATDRPLPAGLLSALRGKDVLLVFVESYGRVAVEGTSYARGVTAVLDAGTARLSEAGFAARSAFLTSPTFGAGSWLAHATLQSGLWVDSQQRYNQLVTERRATLTSAFGRAGWRTVFDVPAVTKDWADGRRFYGFDRLYAAGDVGYRGPRFGYATMPDQYTLAALERLELAPRPRLPVMAEVDLVSSHHPWTPLPRLVDWAAVGDGSAFDPMPAQGRSTDAVLRDPDAVREAYGASVEYAWQTLVSWLVHRPDPDLVLVVLGDHQPHSYVSGTAPGYDVPVSVITRDPGVLDRIDTWGWQPGLRPHPDAPVWRMDGFRDRFLAAFSDPASERSTP